MVAGVEAGGPPPPPLSPLVAEDAAASLAALPPDALRRAFRPRLLPRPLGAFGAAAALTLLLFSLEPLEPSKEKPRDPAAAAREQAERNDAAKAARKLREEAKAAEETVDPRHAALRAVAAEMRRQAEEMLRQNPPKAAAMASFQKMGELARERQELLAGMDPARLQEMKASGELGKIDGDLQKLLAKLLSADMKDLNAQLAALDASLKGAEGAGEWSPEMLAALKAKVDELAEALAKSPGALEGRKGLREGLQVLGDEKLLREIGERLSKLMETLRKQGWEGCKDPKGLNDDGMGDFEPGEPIYLTDLELQAMLDRLKELQELADLGQLSFCKNCGMSGGT